MNEIASRPISDKLPDRETRSAFPRARFERALEMMASKVRRGRDAVLKMERVDRRFLSVVAG